MFFTVFSLAFLFGYNVEKQYTIGICRLECRSSERIVYSIKQNTSLDNANQEQSNQSLIEKKRNKEIISTPLLPKRKDILLESIYITDGNNKISSIDIVRQLLNQTSKIDYQKKQRFLFAYEDVKLLDKKNYTYLSLASAIKKYHINNTILLMLTDKGYRDVFWNSYITSKLHQYKNLVVACLDRQVYNVIMNIIN